MDYRIAENRDMKELIDIRVMYLREDFGAITDDKVETIENSLRNYYNEHLNRDMFAFIAEDNGIIVGSAFLVIVEKPANPRFVNGRTGNVLNVYTRPEYRRNGIAGKLMEMLLESGREKKLDLIELKATEDGHPLYKKLGFIEDGSSYTNMKFVFG